MRSNNPPNMNLEEKIRKFHNSSNIFTMGIKAFFYLFDWYNGLIIGVSLRRNRGVASAVEKNTKKYSFINWVHKVTYHRKGIQKLSFRGVVLCQHSDKGLPLETWNFEVLCGGKFTLSTKLKKLKFNGLIVWLNIFRTYIFSSWLVTEKTNETLWLQQPVTNAWCVKTFSE